MPGRMKAVLIGAGGHARVVLDAARAGKRIDIVCVIDADPAKFGAPAEKKRLLARWQREIGDASN